MNLDWSVIPENFWFLMDGAKLTLIIAIIAILFGFAGGLLLGMARISKNRVVYGLSTGYIEAFRGTPLLVQIFLIYFGLPSLGMQFTPLIAGILALSLNSAAYQAEIFRAGVQSIPKGQMEASRSMGMTYNQSMFHVIIPQALRNSMPTYTNEFITLIKDSSLVMAIGVLELTYSAKDVIADTFQPFVLYIFIAIVYFALTFSTSRIMRFVERKFAIPGTMGGE
ncbi:MAG: amino acid ABC transporter permease [Methanomassiliicoccales archaeon]|jgi:polar amino acid transport system permease protein